MSYNNATNNPKNTIYNIGFLILSKFEFLFKFGVGIKILIDDSDYIVWDRIMWFRFLGERDDKGTGRVEEEEKRRGDALNEKKEMEN